MARTGLEPGSLGSQGKRPNHWAKLHPLRSKTKTQRPCLEGVLGSLQTLVLFIRLFLISRASAYRAGLLVKYTYCIVKGLAKNIKDKTIVAALRPVVTEIQWIKEDLLILYENNKVSSGNSSSQHSPLSTPNSSTVKVIFQRCHW